MGMFGPDKRQGILIELAKPLSIIAVFGILFSLGKGQNEPSLVKRGGGQSGFTPGQLEPENPDLSGKDNLSSSADAADPLMAQLHQAGYYCVDVSDLLYATAYSAVGEFSKHEGTTRQESEQRSITVWRNGVLLGIFSYDDFVQGRQVIWERDILCHLDE